MAKKQNRQAIGLDCSSCKRRNYITSKNSVNDKEKLALNKFCNQCRKVTKHEEAKRLHVFR